MGYPHHLNHHHMFGAKAIPGHQSSPGGGLGAALSSSKVSSRNKSRSSAGKTPPSLLVAVRSLARVWVWVMLVMVTNPNSARRRSPVRSGWTQWDRVNACLLACLSPGDISLDSIVA